MKIAIIGAGAMGLLYASFLSRNNDVILIDKNTQLVDKINTDGFTIEETNGQTSLFFVKAYSDASSLKPMDLVIIFVKDTVTRFAVSENLNLIDDSTMVLSLQNGLGNDEVIKQFVNEKQIFLGTTKHNSVVKGLGSIYHSGSGMTIIGSIGNENEKAKFICNNFIDCNIDTQYSSDVRYLVWEKLFVNMTINSISAVLDCNIGFLVENGHTLNIMKSLVHEAVLVARLEGYNFDEQEIIKNLIAICKFLSTGKASMCQDIENKRKTEIDFINGAVEKLGKKHNIDTPTHSIIIKIIHAKELLY